MRRIAVINQKGGVGKTTTTANVAAALARAGHRVLAFDLDPQSHLSLHLGLDPASGKAGVYELLTGSASINKARVKVAENFWVVGATIDLAAAEVELVSVLGREVLLRDMLDQHVSGGEKDGRFARYDYVLFDCPPSLGVLTLNGLCAAQEVIIPLQPHYLALQGLGKLLETVLLVGKRINPTLRVAGITICMHDAGTKLGTEVVEDVRTFLESARRGNVPWSGARLFESVIRRNIKLAESPSYGQSIFDYAPDSNGARDYERLAREIHDPASVDLHQTVSDAEPAAAKEKIPAPMVKPAAECKPAVAKKPAPLSRPAQAHKPVEMVKPAAAGKATPLSKPAAAFTPAPTVKSVPANKAVAKARAVPVGQAAPVSKPASPAAKRTAPAALASGNPMEADVLSTEMTRRRESQQQVVKPMPAVGVEVKNPAVPEIKQAGVVEGRKAIHE
jgi:chromosome partitioning protein